MKDYWVYMLLCSDGSYYIGVTSDLQRRFNEHQAGTLADDCYTHQRRPVDLAWSELFHDIDDAIAVEKKIKGWSRAKKTALAKGDWEAIHRLGLKHWRR